MYSNSCCSCSFEFEIIKIGLSSHKMYSNNFIQTDLMQRVQFSVSIGYVYTQLNVKNSSFSNNSVSHKYAV